MKKKWIYIAIETAVRELDAKLLLALEFVFRDYNVVFGSSKNITRMSRYLPKGAYFLKDSASFNYEKYKKLRKLGNRVIVHDEEGFVTGTDEEYMNDRLRNDTIHQVDIFFAWGKRQKKLIDTVFKERGVDLEVKSVGHPRVDILRERFTLKRKNFNRILINTKTAGANYRGGSQKLIEDYSRLKYIKNDDDLKFYEEYIKYDKKLFDEYVLLIKEISRSFPNTEIILRSHPNEDETTWIKILSSNKNVIVTKVDSVNSWIEKSDIVIHTGCTTGVEATLMNSVVLAFVPFSDKTYDITFPNEISIEVSNIEDMIKMIKKVYTIAFEERKNIIPNKQKSLLSYYVSNIENKMSTEFIVDEVDKLELDLEKISYTGKIKMYFRSLFNQLKGEKVDYKFHDIDINLLRNKINRYKNHYSSVDNIEIEEIYNNVYIISKIEK